MKQNRQVILMVAMAVFLVIGGPFWLARKQAATLDAKTVNTQRDIKALRTKIDQAKGVKKNRPNYLQALDTVHAAMPSDNDLKGAIVTLQNLAEASKVEWVSFSLASVVMPDVKGGAKAAAAKKETPATTAAAKKGTVTATTKAPATYPVGGFDINVSVRGSRSDILSYLGKIRTLPSPARLFVVSAVTMDFSRGGVANAAVAGDVATDAQLTLHAVGFGAPPTTVADGAAAGKAPTTTVVAGQTPQPAAVATVAPVVTVAETKPVAATQPEPASTTTTTTAEPSPPASEA